MNNSIDELKILIDKMAKAEFVEDAMRKACLKVEADAKDRCPIGEGVPQLRDSITHVVHREGKEVTGVIGTNVSYAP